MKPKLKRILHRALWGVGVAAALTGLSFANRWQDQATCKAVFIQIDNQQGSPLISEKEINDIVKKKWGRAVGKPLKDLQYRALEEEIRRIPVVESADVFTSLSGITEIHVIQRKPLMKLFYPGGNTSYIDELGYFFSVAPGYSARVLTISGNMPLGIGKYAKLNDIPENNPAYKPAWELFRAGQYLRSHRLLNSLVAQVYYNAKGEVELIPASGSPIILLGDWSDLEWRLDNLLLFYIRTAGHIDLRQYPVLNLKYKNQIVLTKNEP